MRFDGKTAIVTGGSEGIGFAVAEGLASGGARVVLVARREGAAAEAAEKLGPHASYVAGDVAHEETAERAVAHAVEQHGGLDLLVCNAGTLIPGAVTEQPMEQVDRTIAVNLRGTIAFMRQAAPAMGRREGAAAVLVSSATGRQPMAGMGAYGATKAALNYLVPTWAIELAPMRIRVNAVCPGGTYTPALRAATAAVPELEEATIATNLVKRIAAPEEIAGPVLTLLDDTVSGYVTGAIWDVDGGYQRDRGGGS
ncbi:SDR family NAD(P)-dependent oxidoreductase [Allosalinactinospora lopnorensis]|uniref:SDR family NAD(P)-dependent oxidoreductase n=1 Tax=Allosalinactinospora lopnorensis TaxID=1352348 RepID=UPI000623F862|nr:SDR family oxidoreductase [Allosalinactinospora lopnorensis]